MKKHKKLSKAEKDCLVQVGKASIILFKEFQRGLKTKLRPEIMGGVTKLYQLTDSFLEYANNL